MLPTNEPLNIEQLHWRLTLSGLWIYTLLNMLFRDMHELFRTGFLEQALDGVVDGNVVTEITLLYGGIALQIPLLMVPLCLTLQSRSNRWLNQIASTLMFAGVVAFNASPDLDDTLFALMEAMALTAIFVLTWREPRDPSGL